MDGRRRGRRGAGLIAAVCAALLCDAAGADEIVRAHRFTDKGLEVRLPSGGCTTARDFAAAVDRAAPGRLVLRRLRRDDCKAFYPDGQWILFSPAPVRADAPGPVTVVEVR